MKRINNFVVIVLACACLLCGCTERTIIESGGPQAGADGIVWEQLWEDWAAAYEDTATYPFVETVNCSFYPEENRVEFYMLFNKTISEDKAINFAMEAVKGMGDLVAAQNSNYTKSSDTSFGSYLDAYEIYVMAGDDLTKEDSSTWIFEDTVPAGEYRRFQNNLKKTE